MSIIATTIIRIVISAPVVTMISRIIDSKRIVVFDFELFTHYLWYTIGISNTTKATNFSDTTFIGQD